MNDIDVELIKALNGFLYQWDFRIDKLPDADAIDCYEIYEEELRYFGTVHLSLNKQWTYSLEHPTEKDMTFPSGLYYESWQSALFGLFTFFLKQNYLAQISKFEQEKGVHF